IYEKRERSELKNNATAVTGRRPGARLLPLLVLLLLLLVFVLLLALINTGRAQARPPPGAAPRRNRRQHRLPAHQPRTGSTASETPDDRADPPARQRAAGEVDDGQRALRIRSGARSRPPVRPRQRLRR